MRCSLSSRDLRQGGQLLLLAVGLVSSLPGASPLVERSPFLPPDFQAPSTRPEDAPLPEADTSHLQFRGVLKLGGDVQVNIYNTRTNQGRWISLDGEVEGFRLVAYDPEDRAIELEVDGELTRFELAKPSDQPTPVVTTASPATPRVIQRPAQARPGGDGSTVRRRVIVPPRPARSGNPRSVRRTVVPPRPASPSQR